MSPQEIKQIYTSYCDLTIKVTENESRRTDMAMDLLKDYLRHKNLEIDDIDEYIINSL